MINYCISSSLLFLGCLRAEGVEIWQSGAFGPQGILSSKNVHDPKIWKTRNLYPKIWVSIFILFIHQPTQFRFCNGKPRNYYFRLPTDVQ